MSAQLTVAVDDHEISQHLSYNPESFLAVITALADEERHWEFALEVAKESGGSKAEEAVPAFLRSIADTLDHIHGKEGGR